MVAWFEQLHGCDLDLWTVVCGFAYGWLPAFRSEIHEARAELEAYCDAAGDPEAGLLAYCDNPPSVAGIRFYFTRPCWF